MMELAEGTERSSRSSSEGRAWWVWRRVRRASFFVSGNMGSLLGSNRGMNELAGSVKLRSLEKQFTCPSKRPRCRAASWWENQGITGRGTTGIADKCFPVRKGSAGDRRHDQERLWLRAM